jgi:hypothetical protein
MTRDDPRRPTDAEIDRVIESLTGVEPSVEYLTRIRTRIALEPPPASGPPRLLLVAGGFVAAAIVAIIALSNSSRTAPPGGERLAELHSAAIPSGPVVAPTVQDRPVPRVAPMRSAASAVGPRARGRDTAVSRPARAEVLIAQDEARALRRFIARASSGVVQMARAAVADPGPGFEPEPIRDITVPAIAIDPLVSAGPEEGARQ